jgi:hypothetical protein
MLQFLLSGLCGIYGEGSWREYYDGVIREMGKSWYQKHGKIMGCLGVISSEQKGTKSRYRMTENDGAKQALIVGVSCDQLEIVNGRHSILWSLFICLSTPFHADVLCVPYKRLRLKH